MLNVMRAEFFRYKKSALFWFTIIAALLIGIVYGLSVVTSEVFDDIFIIPLFVLLATFFSLMIGREYADGTIRNKVIAGKTKATIYAAQIALSFLMSAIIICAFFVPFSIISASTMASNIPLTIIGFVSIGFLVVNFVWAILFTVVSMLITSREIASIVNLALVITIMLGAYQIDHSLGQQQFMRSMSSESSVQMSPDEVKQVIEETYEGSYYSNGNENGQLTYFKIVESEEEFLNPKYIDEPIRTILQKTEYLLPYGQVNAYVSTLTSYMYSYGEDVDVVPFHLFPLYSLCMLVLLIVSGFVVFRKKDLT